MTPDHPQSRAHWLLRSIYGRQLLKTRLRIQRPDLRARTWIDLPEHEPLLDDVIDVLDLRGWPQPKTLAQRLAMIRLLLHMTLEISEGRNPRQASTARQPDPKRM